MPSSLTIFVTTNAETMIEENLLKRVIDSMKRMYITYTDTTKSHPQSPTSSPYPTPFRDRPNRSSDKLEVENDEDKDDEDRDDGRGDNSLLVHPVHTERERNVRSTCWCA